MGACHRILKEGFAPATLAPVHQATIYVHPPPPCQHQCYAPVQFTPAAMFAFCETISSFAVIK